MLDTAPICILSGFTLLGYNIPSDIAYPSGWSRQKVHTNPYKYTQVITYNLLCYYVLLDLPYSFCFWSLKTDSPAKTYFLGFLTFSL